MGLNIKNAEVEANIRRLAQARGVSLTDAIDHAVRRELDEIAPPKPVRALKDAVAGIKAWREEYGLDATGISSDHGDLYDEYGLPA